MIKFAPLVLHNLVRNRRRTLLTVSSIAVSLFVFSALLSMPTTARQILSRRGSSLRLITSNKAGIFYSLPAAYKRRIASVPHVDAVAGENVFGGIYRDPHEQMPAAAVDPENIENIWPEWRVPREALAEFKRSRVACLAGTRTMQHYGWHIGQDVTLKGTIYPVTVTLRIVGTLSTAAPHDAMIFRLDYLDELLGRTNRVNFFWVKVDGPQAIPMVISALDEMFANSSAETQSESEVAFVGQFLASYESFLRLSEILGLIVIVTMGLVAANTAAMSIRERRMEVAVMRSMGFPSALVLSLLLSESVVLSAAGGLIGCAGAYLVLTYVVPALGINLVPMPPRLAFYGLLIAALTGVVSAIVPALSAARRNIVEGLRMVA